MEDEPAARHALTLPLRHYDYEVLTAGTVAEGLQLAKSEPDFILLDLMLPDGDGMTVLEGVRQRGLRSRVAVLTGVGDPDHLDRVNLLRPAALLKKPVDFSQILRELPSVA